MSISVFLILLLLLTFIVYLEVRKFFINWQLRNFKPVRDLPLIGVIERIAKTSNYEFIDLVSTLFEEAKSPTIRFWIGPFLMLGLYDPASVEIILTHENSTILL